MVKKFVGVNLALLVLIVNFKVVRDFKLFLIFNNLFFENQGRPLRCAPGVCQAGTCVEQTIGASTHAYCQCIPGYRGINCNECLC